MNSMPILSVVSPIFHGAKLITTLAQQLKLELEKLNIDYEIVLVEDGSKDDSWQEIVKAASQDVRIKGVKFSRNFGQHYAISAGLAYARGDYVVVIDSDLQDHPRYIAELLSKAQQGFDVVFTKRTKRSFSLFKNITAICYNYVFNELVDSHHVGSFSEIGSFSILSRKVVNAFCKINDCHRHYLLIVRWLGFASTHITVEHSPRITGKSSYTFSRLIRHAIDGIASQSTRLLRLSFVIGLILCVISMLTSLFILFMSYNGLDYDQSIGISSIVLLCTGLNLMFLGVVGLYVGKTFEQSKARPLYIVDTTINY